MESFVIRIDGNEYIQKSFRLELNVLVQKTPFEMSYGIYDKIRCKTSSFCEIVIDRKVVVSNFCRLWVSKVKLYGQYFNRTLGGLCGSWDRNINNDFQGLNTNEFGESCRVHAEPEDLCQTRQERHLAEEFCAAFKREPFASCPLNEAQLFNDCVDSVCADPSKSGFDRPCKVARNKSSLVESQVTAY